MEMWQAIVAILGLVSTGIGYLVMRNKNKVEGTERAQEYARDKSKKNESADDRQDIINQEKRLKQQQEAAAAAQKPPEENKP